MPMTRSTKPRMQAATANGEVKQASWFEALLSTVQRGKSRVSLRPGDVLFSQGEAADAVFFIEQGKVRLAVLSKAGKEAILAVLMPGDLCGEGCLAGQQRRAGTATALTAAIALRIRKAEMVRALHEQHALSEAFLARLFARSVAVQEDVCAQLFEPSEKLLARTLLKLARFGSTPESLQGNIIAPKISQEALAEMIGSTRSHVNFFMTKFRRLGLIEYNRTEIQIHPELLSRVVLRG